MPVIFCNDLKCMSNIINIRKKETPIKPFWFNWVHPGAQKATAVEHINQNSFLLIIFARTVIAFPYDISYFTSLINKFNLYPLSQEA